MDISSFYKKFWGNSASLASLSAEQLALGLEFYQIYSQLLRGAMIRVPSGMLRSLVHGAGFEPIWSQRKIYDLLGDTMLTSLDALGPVYGKLSQVALSRLNAEAQQVAAKLHLTRVYGQWPSLPYADFEAVLDRETPRWRDELTVDTYPLGVASMAQVHLATDRQGREWVIKVIKPDARRRLEETLRAMEQFIWLVRPFRLTATGARTIRELEDMIRSLRREVKLDLEKGNIDRMREQLDARKQTLLKLPKTLDAYCTENVLVLERFRGSSLIDIVSGRAPISSEQRKTLAKRLLQELLLQVFELGLFHGDPHAGNLILLEDGTVGIFDWGLTGELRDLGRKHISGILKALLMSDMDRLVNVLRDIASDHGYKTERADVEREIRRVATLIREHRIAGTQAPLEALLEACLSAAERLKIPVPDGLLLLAKSMLTIEGLARGIDPEVSFARAAGPILLKAAQPSLGEILTMGKRLPSLLKRMMGTHPA